MRKSQDRSKVEERERDKRVVEEGLVCLFWNSDTETNLIVRRSTWLLSLSMFFFLRRATFGGLDDVILWAIED